MTNKEKYAVISERIEHVNSKILKNFPHKLSFESLGSGLYIVYIAKNPYKFATLGDVISFLTLFSDIFELALERKK